MGASEVSYVVPIEGRTLDDIYADLRSQALARSGYEYSGDLGSKSGGYVVVGRLPDATADDLRALEEAIREYESRMYEDEDGQSQTLEQWLDQRFPLTTSCPGRCWSDLAGPGQGQVLVKVYAKIRTVAPQAEQPRGREPYLPSKMLTGSQPAWVERPCRICKGAGVVPLTGEELKARKQQRQSYEQQRSRFGSLNMQHVYGVWNDKWGPAAMVVGKDHVWVGGLCSS